MTSSKPPPRTRFRPSTLRRSGRSSTTIRSLSRACGCISSKAAAALRSYAARLAAELHGFVEEMRLTANGPVDIVGHDLGTWIGYAYAAEWPDDVKRLAVFDAALPGITPPPPAGIPSAEANVRTWHLAFIRLDD